MLVLLLAAWALLLAAERGHRGFLLLAMALIGARLQREDAGRVRGPADVRGGLLAGRGGAVAASPGRPGARGSRARRGVAAVDDRLRSHPRRPSPVRGQQPAELHDRSRGGPQRRRSVRAALAVRTDGECGRDGGAAAGERAAGRRARPKGYARLFVRAPVGPLRLGDGLLAAQAEWLLPLALVGALGLGRGPARPPLPPAQLGLLLWIGWTLTYAVVYSAAGGIFHFYYLSTLGPPLAALAAIGVIDLWQRYRDGRAAAVALAGALLVTAMWQVYVHTAGLPAASRRVAAPDADRGAPRGGARGRGAPGALAPPRRAAGSRYPRAHRGGGRARRAAGDAGGVGAQQRAGARGGGDPVRRRRPAPLAVADADPPGPRPRGRGRRSPSADRVPRGQPPRRALPARHPERAAGLPGHRRHRPAGDGDGRLPRPRSHPDPRAPGGARGRGGRCAS